MWEFCLMKAQPMSNGFLSNSCGRVSIVIWVAFIGGARTMPFFGPSYQKLNPRHQSRFRVVYTIHCYIATLEQCEYGTLLSWVDAPDARWNQSHLLTPLASPCTTSTAGGIFTSRDLFGCKRPRRHKQDRRSYRTEIKLYRSLGQTEERRMILVG